MLLTKETTPVVGQRRPITIPQVVSSFAGGTVGPEGYGDVYGFEHVNDSDDRLPPDGEVPSDKRKKVIIVGAGISAIQQAAILVSKGDVKHDDVQIFEALDGFGGVWQKNKYPGCACDVPSMVYTSSFFVNKLYSHFFATREEIQNYYQRFAYAYKLEKCTQFNSFVKSCIWDDDALVWKIRVQNKASDKLENWAADVLIQCVGSLDRPKFGTTPGREKFKGLSWHTSSWRHDVDLTGKRVGIIGLGPSVAQIVPEIVDKVASVTVYIRTPPVCLPRNDYAFSRWFRWALRWIPGFAWYQRQKINWDMHRNGQNNATDGSERNNMLTQKARDFLKSQVMDPKLREILEPDSKYLCKRPLFLDTLYSSLVKPNCTVVKENLIRYTEEGIISADRSTGQQTEQKFDIILFGTGFNVASFLEHEKIAGIGGLDLQEKWREHPEALYGVATNGFPNLFMCFGPNSAHVWSSQQDTWEQQARLNAELVREIIKRERSGRKLAVHPTRDAEIRYNNEVQIRQAGKYVWSRPDCITYYKNDTGWITYTMPWSWGQFRRMLSKVFWHEWISIEIPTAQVIANGYLWESL